MMIVKLATIVTAFLLAASVQAQDLPNGAGKELVMTVCTQCHDTARIVNRGIRIVMIWGLSR